ncbi:hypothetical protein PVAND_010282 [Polypedilum vanderplanki]|uniref:General transcription factor 3C polypeptide 3 n=1 Tax=Polypedilum vanderplanki TaxID=319348 RepID=A0A9J6CFF1_POLVA|nr:hypothetical protein PVAND_010282 [Polypedilum vanderplanki]
MEEIEVSEKFKKIIIEEVEQNTLTEAELAEFVQPDEIPILNKDEEEEVFAFGSDDDDSIGDSEIYANSSSEEDANSAKKTKLSISNDEKKITKKTSKPATRRSRKKTVLPEKFNSLFLEKFMSGEISYSDYANRIGDMSFDDDNSDGDESDASTSTIRKFKKRTRKQKEKAEIHHAKKIKRQLPPALQGVMGQANLCFARGDREMAEKLCLEIIRQEPMAAEPFITLSQIYENVDDQKYLDLQMIAAHVNSTAVQWVQVAEIFLERNNFKQASYCYAKATRCDPKNLSYRIKRLEILKMLGDEKHVLHCTFCMLGFIPKEDHKFLISQAKWVAQKYHEEGLITKSLDAMLKAYKKVPEHFTTEDVHSLIELLMHNKQFFKCLDVLISHTGLTVKIKQKGKETADFSELYIPNDMLMDLRTKMCICLINLNAMNLITQLIDNALHYIDVEKGGDCYIDIAEALILKEEYLNALRLLDPLIKSKSFSLAAVWLKHAECLRVLNRYPEAIVSYKKVVELSHHIEARLTLAALLKFEGRMIESLDALTQDPQTEIMSTELLKEKCLLLKDLGKIDEYLQNGYMMLLRHCIHYRSRQEVQIVSNFTKTSDRLNELKNLRKNREEVIDDVDSPEFSKTDEPTVSDDWNFFCDLIKTAWSHKKYVQLQRISFAGMSSRRLQLHVRTIDFMGVIACLFNKEEFYGYNKIREFLSSDRERPRFWNLFNLIAYVTHDTRYHRFMLRLFDRCTPYSTNIPPLVYLMIANYCLLSNSYKYAISHYDEIYRKFQLPMVAMILAILYSQIANQKYTNGKQSLLLQAIQYMEKYRKTREPEASAEILYNTGRLYHQMGIVSVAKDYYEKALKSTHPLIEQHPEILDLKREIAYNLHIIYKQSGNKHMARKILYEHIVV